MMFWDEKLPKGLKMGVLAQIVIYDYLMTTKCTCLDVG